MMKKKCFVTLFDARYLSRGLVMYESLMESTKQFILYIIAFDHKCYEKLMALDLKNVVLISLPEFEDAELIGVKDKRTNKEYSWTCTAKAILYVLERYGEDECTYIDADLYFFSSPICLIDELEEKDSVLITEHRYSDYCDQTRSSGKYCVQFVTFKNNKDGMMVLRWWSERCIDWCYARVEEGKFGDQKYLEQFGVRFEGVHELQHLGGGVAPWNINQYMAFKEGDRIYLKKRDSEETVPLIFYHFHGLKFFDKDVVRLTGKIYKIPDTAVAYIYKTYIRATETVCDKYKLREEQGYWTNAEIYRDNDMDALNHDNNYYLQSLFL